MKETMNMHFQSLTLAQQYAVVAFFTFIFAWWQSRLFLWGLFPLFTFVTRKYCFYIFNKKNSVYNSSWLLTVVKLVGSIERALSTLTSSDHGIIFHGGKCCPNKSSVQKESDKMLQFISKDFILSWYQYIGNNEETVEELSGVLEILRSSLLKRLGNVDKYVLLRDFVNLYQRHLHVVTCAKVFLRKQPNIRHKGQRDREFKKIKTVFDVLQKQGKLHSALRSVNFEIWHLQSVFDICFMDLLDLKLYHSELPRKTIRDIVVKSVLLPFINILSQPYWLHFIIVKLTSDEQLEQCNQREGDEMDKQNCHGNSNRISDTSVDCCLSPNKISPCSNKREDENLSDSCCTYSASETSNMDLDVSRPLFELSDSTDGTFEDDNSNDIEFAEDVSLNVSSSLEKPSNVFIELSFGNTEKIQEQRSGSVYTIYSMQYLAWHQNEEGGWEPREGVAKRRFREFVTLHERLEDHAQLRLHLKGIKGPTKWMTFSFSNLNDETVKKRKIQLERYMKQLLLDSELSNSLAVREFLAYEGDTSIAFVRRPSELYKINQMMINTVKRVKSNVIDKLKPSSGQSVPSSTSYSSLPDTAAMWTDEIDPDALTVTSVILEEKAHIQKALEWVLVDFEEQMQDLYEREEEGFFDALDSSYVGSHKEPVEGCGLDMEVPLASSLLDLALQTVTDKECWVRDEVAVRLAKLAVGRFLELFVRSELDLAFTPERCTYYIQLITDTLWPEGVLDTNVYEPSPEQCKVTREQAKRCLQNFFPGFLPIIIGRETFDYSVDQFMNSLDDPTLNKYGNLLLEHFAYQLLDLMLTHLCPSINTASAQTHLINKSDCHSAEPV